MPNYNYNCVTIDAKYEDVCAQFIKSKQSPSGWFFNMHQLFPDDIPKSDPTGLHSDSDHLDRDWCTGHTGSKWFPEIGISDQGDEVVLTYDTAWSPNNLTLLKLSELTGWWIQNEYEEPGCQFEGTYICLAGEVLEDDIREYRPDCSTCGTKYHESRVKFDADTGECICRTCEKKESAGKGEKP